MSLHIEFEAHSWYMGFAIKDNRTLAFRILEGAAKWEAFTDNGNTYRIDELHADNLKDIRYLIRAYHLNRHNGYGERIAARRLEELRGELRAERISTGELVELQGYANYIKSDDTELLEAAGVPEGARA